MASSQASWSWHNLTLDLTSNAAVTAFFHGDTPVECYQDAFYAAAGKADWRPNSSSHAWYTQAQQQLFKNALYTGLIILFRLLSFICETRNVANYHKLEGSAKLIYVIHWAFFLLFVATAVPYSFAMVRVLFAPNGMMGLVEKSTFRSLTFPLAFQLCMYVYEVSLQLQHASYAQATLL